MQQRRRHQIDAARPLAGWVYPTTNSDLDVDKAVRLNVLRLHDDHNRTNPLDVNSAFTALYTSALSAKGYTTNGLYAVLLGDTSLPGMLPVPPTVFTNSDVRLRIWFSNGSGFQQLSPDQRIAAVVNVRTSTIARESDAVLPTLAGPEIGVASTKAFTCQLSVLACLAIAIGRARGTIVDLDALAESLKLKHLAGAAVDVFPVEPSSNAERFVTPQWWRVGQ